ncbi:probable LRR receptor-like serine/threonine-protein kinase At1g05700 [Mercurialis annua]|uniref:probable LRR receptor-like serine/threonine-protein kinase At1g05700 n=1 Tax=Mercurialis annua TaxID=3986 RepID=UPI00215E1036|nr:probable LRR receptor-like serine/threonine-protein kinase At1g05700 [Mercurialis annua]
MAKFLIFLLLMFLFKTYPSQDITNWVRIDCGSDGSYVDNGLLWQTDDRFIKTGENKQISPDSPTKLDQLKTLRVFKEQNKNCYSLPAPTTDRYFIRAMFHYGDYDGNSNPPSFDLEFDGNKWITVETSMTGAVFHELMYKSKGENISVCLARTEDTQFPFISVLEAWAMPDDSYSIMSKDRAWIIGYRYNYGGTDLILGYPNDRLNRIWKPITPSGLLAVQANFTTLDYTVVNEPPDETIIQAVQSQLPTESIIFPPFEFDGTNRLYHVDFYFTEIDQDPNAIRNIYLYVNDALEFTITPQYKNCTGYMINTQSFGSLIVSLVPTLESTLPPIISAIEVYTATDPLVGAGTSQDDLDGLAVLINSFEQLQGWSGEPCLPRDTVWQWLSCDGFDPPRVTSINLTGYGLNGPLPDFSKMQELETINLSNNSLDGPIPVFLGNLPNLNLLDLRDNDFSGDVPRSIANNNKLTYYIDGNINLQQRKKKNSALIVGLAVGIPIGILLVIAVIIIIYVFNYKQPSSSQGQAPETEITGGIAGASAQLQSQEDSSSALPISTSAMVKPVHPTEDEPIVITAAAPNGSLVNLLIIQENAFSAGAASGEANVSDTVNAVVTSHQPVSQDIDEEELKELLRQHGSSGAYGRI